MNILVKIGSIEIDYVPMITDAPQAYDGFGTIELKKYDYPLAPFTRLDARLVLVRAEHVEWHRGRYSSGMFSSWIDADIESATGLEVKHIEEALYNNLCGKSGLNQ